MQKILIILLSVLLLQTASADVALTKVFSPSDYHYTIHYPNDWRLYARGNGVVVFKKSPLITINIQTIFTKQGGGKYVSVKDLMNDFYIQVPMHVNQAQFIMRAPITLNNVNGEQTMLTFKENHIVMQQWQIMLMSSNGILFQAFAYRAPKTDFDNNLPWAKAMLATWNINS